MNERFQALQQGQTPNLALGTTLPKNITSLEDESRSELIDLDLADLEAICIAYGTSPILLLPLFSKASDGPCIVGNMDAKERLTYENPGHAVGAKYLTPDIRLKVETGITVVQVELDLGGWSDYHYHDGEEIIVVRNGSLEVDFTTAGTPVVLSSDDVIHFYSEQPHFVRNVGICVARFTVLRFPPAEVRNRVVRGVDTRLERLVRPKSTTKPKETPHPDLKESQELLRLELESLKVLRSILRPFPPKTPSTKSFSVLLKSLKLSSENRLAFSRLLNAAIRRVDPNFALADICRDSDQFGISVTKIRRLLSEDLPPAEAISINGEEMLAACDAVTDKLPNAPISRLLAFDYLFPQFPGVICIRRSHEHMKFGPILGSDLYEIPTEFSGGGVGARYLVPRRRLAASGVSMAWLELPHKGSQSPVNRHAGFETLIPILGRVRISLGTAHVDVDANEASFAQFSSDVSHQVTNETDSPAKLLVVRIVG